MAEPDRLTALDATFLELEEADESAHMHIGAVMICEARPGGAAPPIDHVRQETLARLGGLPRYRHRLSEPRTGGLRWPAWEPDPHFEIANHVRADGLPAPADTDALREWAGDYFSIRLDRSRPLWELVVLELSDGRWVMVSKTHHALVDGVGSVDAAKVLLDVDPNGRPEGLEPPADESPARDAGPGSGDPGLSLSRLASIPVRLAGRALHLASVTLSTAAHGLGHATDPHWLAGALRESKAVLEVLIRDELDAAPRTSINKPIGAHRRLGIVEVQLADLKRIRASLGGTVNDAVLAAATGGLRELLISRGEELPTEGLRAMVPVNIRPAAERLALGNQITSLFVHLPVAIGERAERFKHQLEEAEGLKSSTQAEGSRGLIEAAGMAPPVLHSFLARSLFASRLFNVTVTNVPGPQVPLYAVGSEVEEIWPVVPLAAEHAVGIAVLSYNGSVYFCLNCDHDSVTDLEVLRGAIETEISDLLELASKAAGSDDVVAGSAKAG
ncbi:MAG TPA: wax ester/triacylglycerol synthase family O-acyltransferase [Solirubrobacterales bacterium]|nr:wax ester/triacylglycerol synthase family O-acyltransferase [Solirubrobacterales bacterium]